MKCKVRNVLGHYNADIAGLFTRKGERHLASVPLSPADRFVVQALWEQLGLFQRQLREADRQLAQFAESGPLVEREARALLATIPRVGPVTIDVVLSELGDWRRFRSRKAVTAFAGLEPGFRKSAEKCLELQVSKEGSRLLRWAMIQAAWRLVVRSPRWRMMFGRLQINTGSKKKAIVGVARHLLCMMQAILQAGRGYELLGVPNGNQRSTEPPEAKATSARARRKGLAGAPFQEHQKTHFGNIQEPRLGNPKPRETSFDAIRRGTSRRPRLVPLKAASPADRDRVNGGAALHSFVMVTAPQSPIPNRWLSPHPLVDAPTPIRLEKPKITG